MCARGRLEAAVAALTGCAAVLTLAGCYVDAGALQHRTLSYSVTVPLHALVVQASLGAVWM